MSRVVDSVGEENIANNGMKMKIVAYRSYNDVDIQFEDGTVVTNKNYSNFKKGRIANPLFSRVGEVSTANNGMKMKIIEYRSYNDVDIQFEDGTVVTNKSYGSFKKGLISNPLFSGFETRVGETAIATNGMKMKIIEYRSYSDVDIQFEDGTVVTNKNYNNFKSGAISNPLFSGFEIRVGEIVIANNGMKMKIVEYRNANDIDVQFENGVIVKNKSYANFRKGQIGLACSEGREGEEKVANNGMKMKIIAYKNADDIDVQFEDGIIVKNRNYSNFKRGIILHPHLIIEGGVCNVFYNFDSVRKAYKQDAKVYYFCKDERGNSYILTPQQMLEKSGIKSLF